MVKYWYIEGYDSTRKIYEKTVKSGCFSEKQIQNLLMALAANAGLNFNEIIGAYAKKKTRIANDLLYVHRDGLHPIFSCGDNPHFHARIITTQNNNKTITTV